MTAVVKLLVDRLLDELHEVFREALRVQTLLQITTFTIPVRPRLQHPPKHKY
jgi:hypothetical protein